MAVAADRECNGEISRRAVVWLAGCAALVHVGLMWLYWLPTRKVLWGDENTYWQSARALLAGDPSWRPEPLWPDGYPRFLAGIMGVAGEHLIAVQVVQTALLVIAAVVLADLVCRVAGSRIAGFVAGGLMVVFPPLVAFGHSLWSETLHLFLFVAVLWMLVCRSRQLPWCVLAGVATGLALLTKSLLGPFVPVLMVAAFARTPAGFWVKRAGVFALALGVTIAPSVARQYRHTGRLMIADSSAFNLWVGLNDQARRNFEVDVVSGAYREYAVSGSTFAERDAVLRRKISDHVARHSWIEIARGQLGRQYFRLFDKDSYLTDQLPGGAAVIGYGAGYVGAGDGATVAVRSLSYAMYGVLLAAAPLGLVLWRFRDRRWAHVFVLFVLYNLAILFWLHTKSRFRVQMLPVLFMGVGCAVAWMESRVRGTGSPVPIWRWVVVVTGAAALEFFAFAGAWLP